MLVFSIFTSFSFSASYLTNSSSIPFFCWAFQKGGDLAAHGYLHMQTCLNYVATRYACFLFQVAVAF